MAFDPDNADFASLLEQCKNAKDLEDYRKSEEVAAAQKFSQPLAEVVKGKTSAGNLIGTLTKWLKQSGNAFGDTEYTVFLQEAKNLSPKELKNIRGKRKDLIKAIGDNQAEKLLNDLGLN